MGIVFAFLGLILAAFFVYGLIESWNTPGLGKEGFFRKIGKNGG
jgi:hypothetical protein